MKHSTAILLALTLLLPVAAPIAIAWRVEHALSESERFRIPIIASNPFLWKSDTGIEFEYNWNWQPPSGRPEKSGRAVLCITMQTDAKRGPEVNLGEHGCRARIIGWHGPGGAGERLMALFHPRPDGVIDDRALRRIQAPAGHFRALADLLIDSRADITVEIAVTRDHKAKLLGLYVNGQKAADYFKGKK